MVEGLDGVDDQNVRLQFVDGVHQVVQAGFRQEVQPLPAHFEPFGPQLDLPFGFLAGDVQHVGKPAQRAADLEHQRGLADARRAAYQHQGAFDRSPAQHPVQLAHSGGKAQLVGGLHLSDGLGAVHRHPQAAAHRAHRSLFGGLLRRALHNRIPCPAGRALALPLGGLISAFGTVVQDLLFHDSLPLPSDCTRLSGQSKQKTPRLALQAGQVSILYISISSYSREPRPILAACSRQLFHSDSGVELVKWSWWSWKLGSARCLASWLPGMGWAARQASTQA